MITANDIKTKGISCLEKALKEQPEAVITVRGKERYVVMKIEQYHSLREIELEAALLEVKQDVSSGRVSKKSIDEHVDEIFSS
ncbi:MAG: type II toxin-antitoxin system Phd/YefM family antitoxin [Gammaproteobacteria bacterium]|nr:MAG: type II toxin-antitoxin system Phd/YefM family antitoxin [Gammaproteobacteria bacterium]